MNCSEISPCVRVIDRNDVDVDVTRVQRRDWHVTDTPLNGVKRSVSSVKAVIIPYHSLTLHAFKKRAFKMTYLLISPLKSPFEPSVDLLIIPSFWDAVASNMLLFDESMVNPVCGWERVLMFLSSSWTPNPVPAPPVSFFWSTGSKTARRMVRVSVRQPVTVGKLKTSLFWRPGTSPSSTVTRKSTS